MKCKRKGCARDAVYGIQYRRPDHCSRHREGGERNVTGRQCDNCDQLAIVGWPHCGATMCSMHKILGMVRERKLSCEVLGCSNLAYFAHPLKIIPERCEFHALDDDINKVFRACAKCDLIAMSVYMRYGVCARCYNRSSHSSISVASQPNQHEKKTDDVGSFVLSDELYSPCTNIHYDSDGGASPIVNSMELNKSPNGRPHTQWMDVPTLSTDIHYHSDGDVSYISESNKSPNDQPYTQLTDAPTLMSAYFHQAPSRTMD